MSTVLHTLEQTWLDQAQKGDQEAFAEIVEKYATPVYNLCYRMMGGRQDAEDASQETFLRAYLSLGSYDRNRPFGTWLLSIAAHFCIDQIRRRRYPTIAIEDLPIPDLPDRGMDVESKITLKQERFLIQGLLQKLDPIDRAAIIMYYWYGFPYDEISAVLHLSLSAVKSRLHRARKAMAVEWMKTQPDLRSRERRLNESSTI